MIDLSDAALPDRAAPRSDWLDRRWYAVRVAPRTEAKVERDLHAAGVYALAPTARRWVRPRRRQRTVGRWRHVERPLLVGYVLVGIDTPHDWQHVRAHEDYGYVISCDGDPVRIPSRAVEGLMLRVLSGEFDNDERPRRRARTFAKGQRITVDVHGARVEATVTGHAGDHLLVELIELGIKARVPLSRAAAAL